MPPELIRIMHVDDDPDIRDIARLSLETIGGFEVVQCASGEEALDAVKTFSPQLFLLDVMMPKMSGDRLWKELSKDPELAKTPVIFMTAKLEPGYVKELKADGALDVIEKPFDPITLPENVLRVWGSVAA